MLIFRLIGVLFEITLDSFETYYYNYLDKN